MKIKYTVTTHTKTCPNCGEILEQETNGEFTPILAVLSFFIFPIMLSYYLLYFLAFSSPDLPNVGPKYCACPKCLEISKTGNYYKEELYGCDLLNYKFYLLFFIAYGLGAGALYALLIGLIDGFSSTVIVVAILCPCILVGIVITYRILLRKYEKITAPPSGTYTLVSKKQSTELQNLLKEINKIKQKRKTKKASSAIVEQSITDYEQGKMNQWQGQQSIEQKAQQIKNMRTSNFEASFSSTYEQQIAQHKKWQDGERYGKQLVVKDETITNVNLQGVRLQNSKFIGCIFENIDLSNTSFRRCDLSNSTFIKCNLTKTDFTGANLTSVKFKSCNDRDALI